MCICHRIFTSTGSCCNQTRAGAPSKYDLSTAAGVCNNKKAPSGGDIVCALLIILCLVERKKKKKSKSATGALCVNTDLSGHKSVMTGQILHVKTFQLLFGSSEPNTHLEEYFSLSSSSFFLIIFFLFHIHTAHKSKFTRAKIRLTRFHIPSLIKMHLQSSGEFHMIAGSRKSTKYFNTVLKKISYFRYICLT